MLFYTNILINNFIFYIMKMKKKNRSEYNHEYYLKHRRAIIKRIRLNQLLANHKTIKRVKKVYIPHISIEDVAIAIALGVLIAGVVYSLFLNLKLI